MRCGFTLIEILIASIILSAGLMGILTSFSQVQRMMRVLPDLETAQEVMDLGEAAYPLSEIDELNDIDVTAQDVDELWQLVAGSHGARLTSEQKEKYHGFTWEREVIDKHPSDDDLKRVGYLYRVRITVKWGRKEDQCETYVTLWRDAKAAGTSTGGAE